MLIVAPALPVLRAIRTWRLAGYVSAYPRLTPELTQWALTPIRFHFIVAANRKTPRKISSRRGIFFGYATGSVCCGIRRGRHWEIWRLSFGRGLLFMYV